ncbi:MAG: hypothetical protein ACK48N_00190, partial [Planctomyces sp.]
MLTKATSSATTTAHAANARTALPTLPALVLLALIPLAQTGCERSPQGKDAPPSAAAAAPDTGEI